MKKERVIVVKKKSSERICIWFLFAFCVLILCILELYSKLPISYFIILSFPIMLPMIILLVYYETWQIAFTQDKVITRVFWHRNSYLYSQINYVYRDYSYTLMDHIGIVFFDNKKFTIRSWDVNFDKAKKIIYSHCRRYRKF